MHDLVTEGRDAQECCELNGVKQGLNLLRELKGLLQLLTHGGVDLRPQHHPEDEREESERSPDALQHLSVVRLCLRVEVVLLIYE